MLTASPEPFLLLLLLQNVRQQPCLEGELLTIIATELHFMDALPDCNSEVSSAVSHFPSQSRCEVKTGRVLPAGPELGHLTNTIQDKRHEKWQPVPSTELGLVDCSIALWHLAGEVAAVHGTDERVRVADVPRAICTYSRIMQLMTQPPAVA
jgi:hypothetical protein